MRPFLIIDTISIFGDKSDCIQERTLGSHCKIWWWISGDGGSWALVKVDGIMNYQDISAQTKVASAKRFRLGKRYITFIKMIN